MRVVLLLLLCLSVHQCAALSRDEIISLVDNLYGAFKTGNVTTIAALQAPNVVWTSYDLPYCPITGVFKGRDGVLSFFKKGFGFYRPASYMTSHDLWTVDTTTNRVVAPAVAKGVIVATRLPYVSFTVHQWELDPVSKLVLSWTQTKATYIQEPFLE